MRVTAKSISPRHKHRGDGVHLQFDERCMLTTDKDREVEVLLKYNNKPGFWTVIASSRGGSLDDKLKNMSRTALIMDAINLGYTFETNKDPKKARNEELIDYIKQMRK